MARPEVSSAGAIYQLKVTLKEIRPPIWRRVQVRGDVLLAELHEILQIAMGWWDCHLHEFEVGQQHFGVPDPDDELEVRDERSVRLAQVAPLEKARLTYLYDFGDDWEHAIVVEKILPPEPGVQYPRCTAGRRACPPEDVGSVPGYASFLEALRDPEHEDHGSLLEWIGGSFDPEAFDPEDVNARLRALG